MNGTAPQWAGRDDPEYTPPPAAESLARDPRARCAVATRLHRKRDSPSHGGQPPAAGSDVCGGGDGDTRWEQGQPASSPRGPDSDTVGK